MRVLSLFFIFLISTATLVNADVPMPGVEMPESVKQALRRMEAMHAESDLAQQMQARKAARASELSLQKADVMTMNVPLLLGTYDDSNNRYTREQFQNQIYENNPTGTMVDYYREISYGQLELTGQTYGWYRTPQTEATYVGNNNGLNGGGALFTRNLVELADKDVDYSQYDNDGDGYVDVVMIVHTGAGAETGANNIWSHRWSLNGASRSYPNLLPDGEYVTNDPRPGFPGQFIKVNDYIIQPEEKSASNTGIIDIGVFCHEFGHALGLPDLYDYDDSSEGIGNWGLMSGGAYGADGRNPGYPAHMIAWSKEVLGWIEPITVSDKLSDVAIPNVEENRDAVYRIWADEPDGDEYFLIENRQKIGFDRFLFEAGILIWHVDKSILQRGYGVNNNEKHKGVDLEEADGQNDLDFRLNRGDAGDPFPGASNNRLFNDATQPNSRSYLNRDSGFAIRIDSLSNTVAYIDMVFTPALLVTPTTRNVAPQSGSVEFDVKNLGGGNMAWNASSSANWLRLSQSSFTNDSKLIIEYDENVLDVERTAQILVSADDAENSPQTITLTQFAAGEWKSPIVFTDRNGQTITLSFGQVHGASDGLDPEYETELPDAPLANEFDARFELPDIPNGLRDDYRSADSQLLEWRMRFQSAVNGFPMSLTWDSNTLPDGSIFIKDEFTGTLISVNMREKDELIVPTSSIKSLRIIYSKQKPHMVDVNSGWNLLSLPFVAKDNTIPALFPNALSRAFYYRIGYESTETLENGVSYWIKFSADDRLSLFGDTVSPQVISVHKGWNLIGPFDQTVAVADLTTNPNDIIKSGFIDSEFASADSLIPGNGYWVQVNQPGELVFPSATSTLARANIYSATSTETSEQSYEFPLVVSDAAGNHKTLWFGLNEQASNAIDIRMLEEELPPLPPKGAFDARFVGHDIGIPQLGLGSYRDIRRGDELFSGTIEHEIEYQAETGPITLVWELPEHITGQLNSMNSNMINKEMRGRDSLSISLTNVIPRLKMRISYAEMPKPSLTITSPTGGETLIVGQDVTITWDSERVEGLVDIQLSRDNGTTFETLAQTENTGTFTWTVEEPVSEACQLRITDESNETVDETDESFAIQYEMAVNEKSSVPQQFALLPNYPNPFNPETTIAYHVPETATVRIDIFDTRGALVRTVVNETKVPGEHQVVWNARNNAGNPVPSGVYFYRMVVDGRFNELRRMVVLR